MVEDFRLRAIGRVECDFQQFKTGSNHRIEWSPWQNEFSEMNWALHTNTVEAVASMVQEKGHRNLCNPWGLEKQWKAVEQSLQARGPHQPIHSHATVHMLGKMF